MATQAMYGLGFSPLDIGNRSRGFAEELMVQKRTGQVSMLDANKNVLSYDYLYRAGVQLQSMYDAMIADNALGKIYRVRLDDNLSRIVAANGNLITTSVTFPAATTAINKLKFNVDCDAFTRNGCIPFDASNITITIAGKVVVGSTTINVSASNKLPLINNASVDVSYGTATGSSYVFTLTGVTITAGASFSYTSGTISVHDILVGII